MKPVPEHALELFDLLYDGADADSIIGTASRRPTPRSDPEGKRVHYLEPVRVRDRWEIIPEIFKLAIQQTLYFMPNLLDESALHAYPPASDPDHLHFAHKRVPLEAYRKRHKECMASGKIRAMYFNCADHHVRELIALTVDLDVGRDDGDLTPDVAVGQALALARQGSIPLPSLTAASGSGAYLLWLLKDEGSGRPPPATPENVDRWRKCLLELITRLEKLRPGLKPDRNAMRPCNWFKMPGTVDTKTDKLVYYSLILPHPPHFALADLAKNLNIFEADRPQNSLYELAARAQTLEGVKTKSKDPKPQPKRPKALKRRGGAKPDLKRPKALTKRRGLAQIDRKRILEVELIAQERQGIAEGLREITLYHYFGLCRTHFAITQKHATTAEKNAQNRTTHFNKHFFSPPLPRYELHKIFRQKKPAEDIHVKNSTLAFNLKVTDEEAITLGLESILPPALAEQRRVEARRKKEQRAARRRQYDTVRQAIICELANPSTTNSQTRIATKLTAALPGEVLQALENHEITRQLVHKFKQQLKQNGQLPAKPTLWDDSVTSKTEAS